MKKVYSRCSDSTYSRRASIDSSSTYAETFSYILVHTLAYFQNDKLRTEKNSLEIEVRKLRKKFGVAADKMVRVS